MQLLDLTHRWCTEREDPDVDINDVQPLAAAVYSHNKLFSARYPDPAPFQLPDPRQPARSLTDLLTATAALLARRQPRNAPLLHSARTVHEVIAEENRILESVNCEPGTYTPGDWVKIFEVRLSLRIQLHRQRFPQATRSLLARVPSGVPASGALCIVIYYVRDRPFSLDSRPSRIGCSAWFLSCVFWVRLQQSGVRWGKSCVGSVRFFQRMSSPTPHAFVSGSPFSVCVEPEASSFFFFISAWTRRLA